MRLEQIKNIFVRNCKEYLLAVVMAFLFWFMIKGQAARSNMPYGYGSERFPRAGTRL